MSKDMENLMEIAQKISLMDKDELRQVSDLVKARWNFLTAQANASFRIGDRVTFEGKFGILEEGTVERINPKMIKVKTVRGITWNVSAALLKKAS